MGNTPAPQLAKTLAQIILRAHRTAELVQTDRDWQALGFITARMLFWCGGAIYACRCEGRELRFALQVAHAPVGAMAQHISGPYAIHLHSSRGLSGSIFKHYTVIPLHDEIFLDDLVLWLHRSDAMRRVWTADEAYLSPNSLPWIDTGRVLGVLSVGAPGPASYRRRKSESISPQIIELFTRRPRRGFYKNPRNNSTAIIPAANQGARAPRPSIETIARFAARVCEVSFEDMLTDTRKRAISKARVIATVLATRNGATAASAARLFKRSRSTLIEQVEYYRAAQPEIFADAESRLNAFLNDEREYLR